MLAPSEREIFILRHIHLSLRVTHRIAAVLFGTLLLGVVLLTMAAWRLAQGPVDLDFLTGRVESALNTEGAPTQIKVGGILLAWEGFHKGLDRPLDLRLRDVTVVDATGRRRLEVPRAIATLSVAALLIGRVVPRAVELDGVRLTVTRGADNTVGIDVGSLAEATDSPTPDSMNFTESIGELMRPVGGDWFLRGNPLSQLRRIRFNDLGMHVVDRALGVTWEVPRADLDLIRRGGGGVDIAGSAMLALKDQRATLTVTAASSTDRENISVRFSLSPVVPAALGLPPLTGIDAPIAAEGTLDLSRTLIPRIGTLTLKVDAGKMDLGTGTLPVRSASVSLTGTPETLNITGGTVVLPGLEGQPDTTVSVAGVVQIGPRRLAATLSLGLDQISLADLPRLWPVGLGGGARPWITENITNGMAHDGHLDLALEANSDLTGLTLTRVTGTVEGDNVTVHWLRPVPPAEQGHALIRVVDADTIDILISGGQQRVGTRAPIALTSGLMRIVGMSVKDQDAEIAIQANGPLADVVALLKEPRLKLLSTHPVDLREPSGDATVALKIKLPLENRLTMDDVEIGVTAQLRRGHLTGVAAGRDLDKAELEIAANKKQLTLKGNGLIAGIAAKIDGLMDFQAGKPRDVAQRIAVTGKPTAGQLAAAGFDSADVLSGEIPLTAVWSKQNGGDGEITLDVDLTGSVVLVQPLAWQKTAGIPAKASARLRLSKDRLIGIDSIVADGAGASVRGSAEVANGHISAVRFDRLQLGRTDLSGTVRMSPGEPFAVALSGPMLDMAAKLTEKATPRDKSKPEPPPGPAWTLSGTFNRVQLANDASALSVRADAANDGRVFTRLHIAGVTQPAASFSIAVGLDKGVRRMSASAADAGAFLRGLDAVRAMQDGTLSLNGTFDDTNATHALTGTAEITDFRVRGAPALGKLLQAMTLYGLVDVVRGPGLGFARLTAPFILSDDDLELQGARAFSTSLGMTAKGHLNLHAETAELEGTIVPAYFFNSLLGKIPFVGGLFRTEEGGGLFAARYTIRGLLNDPAVSVNPLSMLTPGFLRGVFGIF